MRVDNNFVDKYRVFDIKRRIYEDSLDDYARP